MLLLSKRSLLNLSASVRVARGVGAWQASTPQATSTPTESQGAFALAQAKKPHRNDAVWEKSPRILGPALTGGALPLTTADIKMQ